MVQLIELCLTSNCSSDVPSDAWSCEHENGTQSSIVGLAESFYTNDDLISGETMLVVTNAVEDKDENGTTIYLKPESLVSTKKASLGLRRKGRKLAQLEGISTLLVVHVTDKDGFAPPQTAIELASDVFTDELNLVRKLGS